MSVTIPIPSASPARFSTAETQLRDRLAGLSPLSIDLNDESALHAGHEGAKAGGGHFQLTLVASIFTGQSTLARHRMVYAAVGDLIPRVVHALSVSALTPEEAAQLVKIKV